MVTVCSIAATLDYEEQLVELLFRSGQEKHCVNITILDDRLLEDQEEFNVTLMVLESRVILNPDAAVVYIDDDDGKDKISLG